MARNLTGSRRIFVLAFLLMSGAALGCGDSTEPKIHNVASVDVSVKTDLEIGQTDIATAIARDESGAPIEAGTVVWTSTAPDVAVIDPESGEIHTKAIGTTEIVATAGGKVGRKTVTVSPPPLLINEVNPDGDLAGGWVEIFNSTPHAIDLAGWFFVTIIGPGHVEVYVFPNGSVIGSGEFVVVDETMIPGLLNANGQIGLFSKFGVGSDGLQWTGNAPGTAYARCPDGDRSGSLVSTTAPTRKAPNVCRP